MTYNCKITSYSWDERLRARLAEGFFLNVDLMFFLKGKHEMSTDRYLDFLGVFVSLGYLTALGFSG
jgi:hypothetical protein